MLIPNVDNASVASAARDVSLPPKAATSPPPVRSDIGDDVEWYVRIPGGEQFGPASSDEFRDWIEQGRVGTDCMVWRQGWSDWKSWDAAQPLVQVTAPSRPIAAERKPQINPSAETASNVPLSNSPETAPRASTPPEIDAVVAVTANDPKIEITQARPVTRKKSKALVYILMVTCVVLLIPLVYVISQM